MRVLISAGEASGDALGAALVAKMRELSGQSVISECEARAVLSMNFKGDSLDVVEYVMSMEDRFGITLSDADLAELCKPELAFRYFARLKGINMHPLEAERVILFDAIGGNRLQDSGAMLLADSTRWGAVGISQSLKVAAGAWGGMRKAKAHLKEIKPGLFIPIDFGYFNVRLARFAKKRGWKVLYFMPPGSWRRDKQGGDLPEVTDEIVTPFRWSAEILNQKDAKAHWFGHPLKQLVASGPNERKGQTIAVLPGSRSHEVELNLPLIAAAVGGVRKSTDMAVDQALELPIEFALAPGLCVSELEALWKALAPSRAQDRFTQGDTYDVLRRATAAIVCSGTATLEAALLRCPMVVVYRGSRGMALQAKLAGFKEQYISLPNIILQRPAVPEFIGTDPQPSQVGEALNELLATEGKRQAQLQAFAEIDILLGPSDAITRTAELAIRMLGDQSVRSGGSS